MQTHIILSVARMHAYVQLFRVGLQSRRRLQMEAAMDELCSAAGDMSVVCTCQMHTSAPLQSHCMHMPHWLQLQACLSLIKSGINTLAEVLHSYWCFAAFTHGVLRWWLHGILLAEAAN